METKKVLL